MHLNPLPLAVAIIALQIPASAQSTTHSKPVSGTPLVVTSVPFTAQEWTATILAHSDGSTSQTLRRVDVTRNTAGSTRRELRVLPPNPSPTVQPTGSLSVDIHDVPNALAIHLTPTAGTATVHELWKTGRPSIAPVSTPVGAVVSAPTQDLGLQSIAGLTARGSRRTLTFPPGAKDPTQTVTETIDTWYSPDLKTILLTQTTDSLNNSTVTQLLQIVQGEPDPTLFTVPQSYTVTIIPKSTQRPQ
jgi:hypothetical protein